jgi:phospholipid transport system substrate-binding protein
MRLSVIIVTCAALFCATQAAAADSVCETFANTMSSDVVAVFHDTSHSEDHKREALSDIFVKAVDTDWIGRFVLGRFFKAASKDEQDQYLKSYRSYITRTYISKFSNEAGMNVEDIQVVGVTPKDSSSFEAKTIIKRKTEEDVRVEYLLAATNGKCKVRDIKIEGVSLLASQRSEFSALASSSGMKGVIAALNKQIAKKP